jgi:hypothetical protein
MLVVLGIVIAPPVSAAVIVAGDSANRVIKHDGSMVDSATGRVGAAKGTPGAGSRAAVFVFRLPTPLPGELPSVVSAHFQFTVVTDLADGPYDIDLYGLGARTAPDVLKSDNFFSASDTTDATLIQASILPSANTQTGAVDTSPAADDVLRAYLNTQYANGADRYVFLRLNPNQDPPTTLNTGVDVAMASAASGWPTLSLTFASGTAVPEPGIGILAAVFGCALCGGCRHSRKGNRRAS